MPRIDTDVKLDFKDVLIRPKRSTIKSRSDVVLKREYHFCHSKTKYAGIPIMAANMDTVGTPDIAKEMSKNMMFTCMHKHLSVDEWIKFAEEHPATIEHVAVSTGITDNDQIKLKKVLDAVPQVNFICLDVANGYTEFFVQCVKNTRANHPEKTIIAGNVVTGEMVEELLLAGADIVKCGIGPGSVCTTRIKTGVGYPQLSAVIECADAAHGLGGHIISDGGCTCAGDVAKAFGAGADFVMLGGMLAGHEESGGELVEKEDGKKFKIFYGMSSDTAMDKHSGGMADYRAAEGKTVQVPFKGPVQSTIQDVLGGVRSSCTYVGAAKLKELSKRTTFVRVSQQANQVFSAYNATAKN
jgi:GMP reductase